MKKYVFLNDENRIIGIQDCELFPDASLEDKVFEFPEGFEIGTEHDYKLIDGQLVYDPLPAPVIDDTPTAEERIEALEAAMLEMILGGNT